MFDMNGLGDYGNKLMGRMFRKVDDSVVWDMSTGKMGVITDEGIATLTGEDENAQIEINMMEQFSMAVPAFAQNTPLNDVRVGDIIFSNKKVKGWVIKVHMKEQEVSSFSLMTPSGSTTKFTPPKVSILGMDSGTNGVMVVRSLINLMPNGQTGVDTLNNNMLPFLMLGGDNMDMESLLPLMLFSQLGANGTGQDGNAGGIFGGGIMNTLLLAKMLGKDSGVGSIGKPTHSTKNHNIFD